MKYFLQSTFLFFAIFLFACSPKEQSSPETAAPAEKVTAGGASSGRIVYINTDTLLTQYGYFQSQMDSLAEREKAANAELNRRGSSLEQEFRSIQKKIQEGLLTPNQIAKEEQRLSVAQQEILVEKERFSQELLADTERVNIELRKKLKELLSRIREEQGYDFILQYGQGSNVLMVNPELDITEMVLTELNQVVQ